MDTRNALGLMYSDVAEFHLKALRFFSGSGMLALGTKGMSLKPYRMEEVFYVVLERLQHEIWRYSQGPGSTQKPHRAACPAIPI
jgi:hypothetical protein